MVKAISDIERNSKNIFLLWDGCIPSDQIRNQIRVCLRSIACFEPEATTYLFSNVLDPSALPSDKAFLVRWTDQDLAEDTPLKDRIPPANSNWCLWSDVFRVLCLWKWGGTYLDVDDIMVRKLPTATNILAACFLTPDQNKRWKPNPVISGSYAFSSGVLPADCIFRLGSDPMTNFCPQNPFLEKWLLQIPICAPQDWGQTLPTTLLADAPTWARQWVNPIPWPDLLYHPYDGGHHPEDKRYSGPEIKANFLLSLEEYRSCWKTLFQSYSFYLVKNHGFSCHLQTSKEQKLLMWIVQGLWKDFMESSVEQSMVNPGP